MTHYRVFFVVFVVVGSCFSGTKAALNDSYLSDCNLSFGCYSSPTNCSNCDYILKWRSVGDSIDFRLIIDVDPTIQSQYIAVGFSYDGLMKNSSVVMCKRISNGSFLVHSNYIPQARSVTYVNSSNLTIGLSQSSATISNTAFLCSFRRLKQIISLSNTFFNLSNPFFIIFSHGNLDTTTSNPIFHGRAQRVAGTRAIDFSQFSSTNIINNLDIPQIFLKLHGILMITTWIFFATTGIIFARYFRFLFPEKLMFGLQFWFIIHRPVMITCLLTSFAAFILILIFKNWTWLTIADNGLINFIHSIFGASTLGVACIQLLAFIRPHKESPRRKYFNYGHRTAGITTYSLSMVTIFLGVYIFFDKNYWIILVGWYGWIIFFVACLESFEKTLRTLVSDLNSFNAKRKELEKWKIGLLIIHLLVSISIFVSFVILIVLN